MNNFSLRIVHKKNLRQEDNKNIRTEFKYGISVFKCIILLLSNGNCGIKCREIKWDVEKNLVFFQYSDGHWKIENKIKRKRSDEKSKSKNTVRSPSFEILAKFSNQF